MSNPAATVDDSQIAVEHRAMWASGDYPKLAAELVAPLGPVLVEATGVDQGDRVLDVAAGTGNAAIPAAKTGAGSWPATWSRDCWSTAARLPPSRASNSNGVRRTQTRCPLPTTSSMSSCRVSV